MNIVRLTIHNGYSFVKWRIAIPEENKHLAINKAKEIYYEKYIGLGEVIVDSEAQSISMTGYTVIK